MLCARLLRPHDEHRREPLVLRIFEAMFTALTRFYVWTRRLAVGAQRRKVTPS